MSPTVPGRNRLARTRIARTRLGLRSSRARFEARARQARRRPVRLVAGLLAVLAVVGGAGWLVWASPVLTVESVQVEGLDTADAEAAGAMAQVPMGAPLARVDTAAIAARVRALPIVRTVSVTRSWPHTIVVSATPRVALLGVRAADGRLWLVDTDAVAFRSADALPPGVSMVNASSPAPDEGALRAVIDILEVLPADKRGAVGDITVTSAELVTFTLGEVQVIWGGSSAGEKKVKVLDALLRTTPTPTVIDVSAPDTPVTR
jgi:cell division protein FtsQ